MTERSHRSILFVHLIFAQFFLILLGPSIAMRISIAIKILSVMLGIVVFLIIFRKFIWHIQDFDEPIDDKMFNSRFAQYTLYSFIVPAIVVTPLWYLFTTLFAPSMFGTRIPELVNWIVSILMTLVVLAEILLFRRFVDYFVEPIEKQSPP